MHGREDEEKRPMNGARAQHVKMSRANAKASVTPAQHKANVRVLESLLKLEGNQICADCDAKAYVIVSSAALFTRAHLAPA